MTVSIILVLIGVLVLQLKDLRVGQCKESCYNLKLELRLHLGKDLRGR